MIPKTPIKKKTIVHLGNVGEDSARKTREYSNKFKKFQFIGIDKLPLKSKINLTLNHNQINAEFLLGLQKLKKESVDLISSEFAVGHYGLNKDIRKIKSKTEKLTLISEKIYTEKTLKLCYEKLKPNGKVILLIYSNLNEKNNALENITNGCASIPFKINIQEIPSTKLANIPTKWSQMLKTSINNLEKITGNNYKFYRITLTK